MRRQAYVLALCAVLSVTSHPVKGDEINQAGILQLAGREKEAAEIFLKLARQGNADAQAELGISYAKGWGVPKNYVSAYMWANIAASNGASTERAGVIRDALEDFLDPASLAKAQALSKACIETNYRDCG